MLSETARAFDAELLEPLLEDLVGQLLPLKTGHEAEALKGLTAGVVRDVVLRRLGTDKHKDVVGRCGSVTSG